MSEASLYAPVAAWLRKHLRDRHPRSTVFARDAHSLPLSRIIRQLDLVGRFPQSELWDIRIDVVGIVAARRLAQIVLVECKAGELTLMDVCQLLGYSLVVKPAAAILLSPAPVSDGLAQLLRLHGRYDVLEYGPCRRLRIVRWDEARGEVDLASVLPPGEHL
ncbi:MAG: hypothetical protein FJ290_25990 [Planctomycetes bacterium]|nr:hypothetical protein [Planctomycetota bacterium]